MEKESITFITFSSVWTSNIADTLTEQTIFQHLFCRHGLLNFWTTYANVRTLKYVLYGIAAASVYCIYSIQYNIIQYTVGYQGAPVYTSHMHT